MRVRWLSGRAVALHVTAVVVVTTFILLARWQVHRALSGNTLSWAYAFEWPFFAGYAVYFWWKLLHGDEDRPPAPPVVLDESEAAELDAYNRYLQALSSQGRRKSWRTPSPPPPG